MPRRSCGPTAAQIQRAFDNEVVELVLDAAWGRFRQDLPAMICAGKGDQVARMISVLPRGSWIVLLTVLLEFKLSVRDAALSPQIAVMALAAYEALGAGGHADYIRWLVKEGGKASEEEHLKRELKVNGDTTPQALRIKFIRENAYDFAEDA